MSEARREVLEQLGPSQAMVSYPPMSAYCYGLLACAGVIMLPL